MARKVEIEQFSNDLARQFNPKRIVLFGSHVWGTPSVDSDVDMLVVFRSRGKPGVWRWPSGIGFILDSRWI